MVKLREVQRIKSEGDYKAAETLVETYGVKVDQVLHKEILERNKQFDSAPYSGFVNPVLVPKMDDNGEITEINVRYAETFSEQMLEYSKHYNFLPEVN
jgi:dipeptidyl-peptidase-3